MNSLETNPERDENRAPPEIRESFSDNEFQDALQVADKMVLAVQNITLYPANHAIYRRSLEEAFETIESFIRRYGSFVAGVEKNHLQYKGKDISRKSRFHEELAYKCFRDGIQYLVFSEGIHKEEFNWFVKIVSRRKVMEDDAEGDIVTDMWEARLAGIKYATNDNLWKDEPLLDLTGVKVGGKKAVASGMNAGLVLAGKEDRIRPDNQALWRLSPADLEMTRRMVEYENTRTFDQDIFDVFLMILKEQRGKEDFSSILAVILECFKRTLSRCEFESAGRFLGNVRTIYEKYRSDNHWALPLLDDFLMMISSPRILKALPGCLQDNRMRDAVVLQDLEKMLGSLAPESILTLGPMLLESPSPAIRNHMNRAVMHLASKDPRPLYQLARSPTPAVARQAIMNLSRLGKTDHIPILLECARNEDVLLKRVAVKALTMIAPPPYAHALPFIFDTDPIVKQTIFHFLIRTKNVETEAVLIHFINTARFSPDHRASAILLYEALGRIGEKEALLFFKSRLFGWPWRGGRVQAIHRQGALTGLMSQKDPEAAVLLKKASKSLWPTIRRAYGNIFRSKDPHGR
ncbi:MAG: HEAT repeat domain-containing protein [Desulfosalsimonadaceae bacterium]